MSFMEKRSWLLQRFLPPYKHDKDDFMAKLSNAFAFGGGGSGLSQEGMSVVTKISRPDYMGAAEFEFGAFRSALLGLSRLRADDKLTFGQFEVKPEKWEPHYRRTKHRGKKPIHDREGLVPVTVYWIAAKSDAVWAVLTFCDLIAGKGHLKEGLRWNNSKIVDPTHGRENEPVGWLDIQNHYLMFVDKEMFEGWKELLDLKPEHELKTHTKTGRLRSSPVRANPLRAEK